MDDAELVRLFNDLVTQIADLHTARAQVNDVASRFADDVIDDVLALQRRQKAETVAAIIPLMLRLEARIEALVTARTDIQAATQVARLELEELELRALIGEVDDDAVTHKEELAEAVSNSGGEIARLDLQIASIQDPFDQWLDVGLTVRVLTPELELELELDFE